MSKSGKRMSKSLKGLLAAVGTLAALGGVFTFLKMTEPGTEESSDVSSETENIEFWHVYSDDISRVEVSQPNGDTYAVNRRVDTVKTTDIDGNEKEEDVCNYILEGYEDLPMDVTGIRLLATRSPELSAISTVDEHPTDLKKYGLDNPIKVVMTVDADDPIEFYIGDKTPVSTYTYIQVKGFEGVYTVGTVSIQPFIEPMQHYLGLTLKEEQADDDDTIVKSVRIERKDLDYDISLVYDKYFEENTNGGAMALHVMEEPIYCLLSADKSSAATHGLFGLTANEVCTVYPTEADIEKAGLNDPFALVTMKTDDGKTTEFRLGNTYETAEGEKYYYGMLDGVNCIYGFSADATVYDDVKAEDITSKNIVDYYVWDLAQAKFTADGLTLDFTGQGESKDDYVLKKNGESFEDLERFRKFYAFLLEARAEELVLEETEIPGEPLAEVHLERQDKKRSQDIAFYDAGGLKAYIAVDGEIRYRCRKSYVETLIDNMKIFDDTEQEFRMTW